MQATDWGMSGYYAKAEAEQRAERTEWEQVALEMDKDELKDIAEEIYKEFALVDGEEYYRQHGLDCSNEDWQTWILEEAEAKVRRKIAAKGAQIRAINDMREAMEYAVAQHEHWTTLSWVVEKIKADDERLAEYAVSFSNMMQVA